MAAYNSEGKSNPSQVVELVTNPDRPSSPCKPVIRGRVLPNSFKMAWGEHFLSPPLISITKLSTGYNLEPKTVQNQPFYWAILLTVEAEWQQSALPLQKRLSEMFHAENWRHLFVFSEKSSIRSQNIKNWSVFFFSKPIRTTKRWWWSRNHQVCCGAFRGLKWYVGNTATQRSCHLFGKSQ